jgi:alkylhydroperoxidase/carboxymuconolactone decarboxylase family protein YurZ
MAYPTSYASTVAIPLPSEQTVQQMFGKSYDPERTLNVLKMFAGMEDLCEATMGIVKAMFAAKGIDPKIREMIILRAAKVLNAPYEAQANVVMAKNAGLSAAEIDAAATDGPVSGISPEYVLVWIVLQKSNVADPRIFRENTKRETIADSYNLNRVTEVACEFNVRRRGPSHLYTKPAPAARRIFDHQCKTTFATQSCVKRPMSYQRPAHCATRPYANFLTSTVRQSLVRSCL